MKFSNAKLENKQQELFQEPPKITQEQLSGEQSQAQTFHESGDDDDVDTPDTILWDLAGGNFSQIAGISKFEEKKPASGQDSLAPLLSDDNLNGGRGDDLLTGNKITGNEDINFYGGFDGYFPVGTADGHESRDYSIISHIGTIHQTNTLIQSSSSVDGLAVVKEMHIPVLPSIQV